MFLFEHRFPFNLLKLMLIVMFNTFTNMGTIFHIVRSQVCIIIKTL